MTEGSACATPIAMRWTTRRPSRWCRPLLAVPPARNELDRHRARDPTGQPDARNTDIAAPTGAERLTLSGYSRRPRPIRRGSTPTPRRQRRSASGWVLWWKPVGNGPRAVAADPAAGRRRRASPPGARRRRCDLHRSRQRGAYDAAADAAATRPVRSVVLAANLRMRRRRRSRANRYRLAGERAHIAKESG